MALKNVLEVDADNVSENIYATYYRETGTLEVSTGGDYVLCSADVPEKLVNLVLKQMIGALAEAVEVGYED